MASSLLSPPLYKPLSQLPGAQSGVETGALPDRLTSPLKAGGMFPQYKGKYKLQIRAWKERASCLLSAQPLSSSKECMNASVLEAPFLSLCRGHPGFLEAAGGMPPSM